MRRRSMAVAGCVCTLALGAVACGGGDGGGGSGTVPPDGTVDIYSSLPLQGASKEQTAAMVDGIELALEQAGGRAGNFAIDYESLDDSTAEAGTWDPGATARAAREAALDPKAVGYIGDFDSGASAISIPILNQAGIPQISPANTYVGLTTDEPGSQRGEPAKYYPTGKRTYLRLVPRDTIQSAALLRTMKRDGCTKVAIANDKGLYGVGLARLMEIQAKDIGVSIVANEGIDKAAASHRSLAWRIKGMGADCFVFSGVTANGAVQVTKDVAAALPDAKLYGSDGICESAFTNPAQQGIPKSIAPRFQCSVATPDLRSSPAGRRFLEAFTAKYGDASPDPYAVYGYEAMRLFIDAIERMGDRGDDKKAVLDALFATKHRRSVLGTYSFDDNGDTSLTDYGIYTVGDDGDPTFSQAVTARR